MSGRPFTLAWLRDEGFEGFSSIGEIRSRRSIAPAAPGVYVVLRQQLGVVEFLERSTGGWFKERDPSVPIEKLEAKWVPDARVLYIGKADGGGRGARGIRVRLGEYLRFGQGEPVGHWGGRYLWHLARADELLVCWRTCQRPPTEEAQLLNAFREEYGALPFANLKSGSDRRSPRGPSSR